jgi:CRP/FNR family cyclic AMP-dependent transcriptional regulator
MYNYVASEETHENGRIIFEEGSSGDWVYVILSGSVEISRMHNGKKVVIEVLEKDEIFGELSFLGGIKRSATARAVGETTLGVIDRDYLDQQFNTLSTDFRAILVSLVMRFKKMSDKTFGSPPSTPSPHRYKTLSLSYKDGKSFARSYALNVKPGGLFISSSKPLNQGETFILKLQLPNLPEPMKILCEVSSVKKQTGVTDKGPSGMVVRFNKISEKDLKTINQYLEEITG